ncbi:MAG: peroxiredoxin [Treponemataceae bacterium]
MLSTNILAPDFSLPDQDGVMHSLSQYRGKKVVLYFYSKDNTAGCTKQSCAFSELQPQFEEKNALIIGVSKDSVESHKKFAQKYNLKIILLSDPELSVLKLYDVWKEKNMYGKKVMGTVRTTYLIDENGIIVNSASKVKAEKNPQDALELLDFSK